MEWLQFIIAIGSTVTAIIVLWKAVKSVVHLADEIKEVKEFANKNKDISEDVKDVKKHTLENHLMILRLTVMSHEMPLGERIIAGDAYIKEGGNGEVKKFIENELHANELRE